ncbi:hypothetical protein AB1Y20_015319 [Prymnesium parvum]|uniref:Nudix hydrolase domain-containing protein n=1 Tax=Prymnesium parvum TaxID=97485 RepID=A0AB34K122_PRYPA
MRLPPLPGELRYGPSSARPYLCDALRPADRAQYRAAGVLAFRVCDQGDVQVLLTRHMRHRTHSSNDVRQRASTWNLLGGKREEEEASPLLTAAREMEEESGLLLSKERMRDALRVEDTKVLWIPRAAYVVYITEICRTQEECAWDRVCRLRPREMIGVEDVDQATDTLQWLPWSSLATCPPSRGSPYKKQVVTRDGVLVHPFLAETIQRSVTGRLLHTHFAQIYQRAKRAPPQPTKRRYGRLDTPEQPKSFAPKPFAPKPSPPPISPPPARHASLPRPPSSPHPERPQQGRMGNGGRGTRHALSLWGGPPRSAPPPDVPPRDAPPRDAIPRRAPPLDAPPRSAPPRDAPPRAPRTAASRTAAPRGIFCEKPRDAEPRRLVPRADEKPRDAPPREPPPSGRPRDVERRKGMPRGMAARGVERKDGVPRGGVPRDRPRGRTPDVKADGLAWRTSETSRAGSGSGHQSHERRRRRQEWQDSLGQKGAEGQDVV